MVYEWPSGVRIRFRRIQQTGRIRTHGYGPFLFLFVADIVVNDCDFIGQVYLCDKGLQEPLTEIYIIDVTTPALDILLGKSGAFYFCLLQFQKKLLLFIFPCGQPCREAAGPAFFYRVQRVPLALFI